MLRAKLKEQLHCVEIILQKRRFNPARKRRAKVLEQAYLLIPCGDNETSDQLLEQLKRSIGSWFEALKQDPSWDEQKQRLLPTPKEPSNDEGK